jgi:CRISPR/Cas system-associated endoribonuclease Cas2
VQCHALFTQFELVAPRRVSQLDASCIAPTYVSRGPRRGRHETVTHAGPAAELVPQRRLARARRPEQQIARPRKARVQRSVFATALRESSHDLTQLRQPLFSIHGETLEALEVQPGFEQRMQIQDATLEFVIDALPLRERLAHTQLLITPRRDPRPHRLRLQQIHAPILKGTSRELARPRRPRSKLLQSLLEQLDQHRSRQDVQFHDVFARIRGRPHKAEHQRRHTQLRPRGVDVQLRPQQSSSSRSRAAPPSKRESKSKASAPLTRNTARSPGARGVAKAKIVSKGLSMRALQRPRQRKARIRCCGPGRTSKTPLRARAPLQPHLNESRKSARDC